MSLSSIAALQVELLHGDNHDRLEEQTAGFHQRFHDYCVRDWDMGCCCGRRWQLCQLRSRDFASA